MASLEEVQTSVLLTQAAVAGIQTDVGEIKAHAERVNGALAAVRDEQARMDGSMTAYRWMFASALAVGGFVVTVVGATAGYFARGG